MENLNMNQAKFTGSHQTGTKTSTNTELTLVGEGIVARLSSVLNHKVGVTDLSGNIVADSELSNFDKFVPTAAAAIQKGAPVQLPSGEVDEMSGWVIPLKHQERLFGTLLIRNKPTPSDDVIPLAKSLSELLMYQMLVMDRVAQQNRVLDKFFYDLFQNTGASQEKLVRDSLFFNSQFFQFDFNQPRLATVIMLENFWHDILEGQPILPSDEHKLTAVKDQIAEAVKNKLNFSNPIIAYLGMDEFSLLLPVKLKQPTETTKKKALLKKTEEETFSKEQLESLVEELENKIGRTVYMGVGQYYPEIIGLIKSYKGAKKAAQLGHKLHPKTKVHELSELLLPIILEQSDKELQKQFVDNELSDLIEHQDLVETLSTHFDSNLNLKKTAFELGIHKNTLYYRLAKIKKILGIDPQEFYHAVRLKTALYLWQMNKED